MRLDDPKNFQNRELSWLDFNLRVLAEAERPETPLLERAKFLAIVSANLDEFFMIRVSMVHRAAEADTGPLGPDGLSPRQTLAGITERTQSLVARQYRCLREGLLPALAKEGIHVVRDHDFEPEDLEFLRSHFDERIYPVLTPMAVDKAHPLPLLSNCALYVLFLIQASEQTAPNWRPSADTVLVQVPLDLPRFVRLPSPEGRTRLAPKEDVIKVFAARLLGGHAVRGAHPFRVTRDADIRVDEEQADDLLQAIQEELRSRRKGEPVRLEVPESAPEEVVEILRGQLGLGHDDVYRVPGLLDLGCLQQLSDLVERPDLRDDPWPPQPHPVLLRQPDVFAAMRDGDFVVHHPYQSFDPVLGLVERAADDPDVLAIKIALYRVSGDSPVVAALIRAAENGKQVTAVVELRARFDEAANISWARRLDEAGAHVVYGVVGFKTHAKALLVVRQESDGIRRYVHLGTGNYNDRTARLYADLGYFTSRAAFGADLSAFFNVLSGYSMPPVWRRIAMAPTNLRERLLALIEREIEKHSPETPGFIRAKLNQITDAQVIQALYRASQAGVRIDLVVRGICRLRAGVPGLSETIRIVSVVDRFLEHSRILHLHNGGNEEVYLASADWMERNLYSRLELLFPVLDSESRAATLLVLDAALADNTHAWERGPDDVYRRVPTPAAESQRVRSQEVLYSEACAAAAATTQQARQGVFLVRRAEDVSPGREANA